MAANEWCAHAGAAEQVASKRTLNKRRTAAPPRTASARVRNPVDHVAVVVAEQQRAVAGFRHARGSAPRLRIGGHEARQEIDVLAGGHAVLHRHADYLVAGAVRAVPRAME